MKLGRQSLQDGFKSAFSRPKINQSKRELMIFSIVVIATLLIAWVIYMGFKAEKTITVVMLNNDVYKNQTISEEDIKPYDMLQGEFEKYAVVKSGGVKKRRLILWEERNKILNGFAAYPLKKDTLLEYRDLIKSRADNKDTVLYTFPGKEIVPLEVGHGELEAFKAFLRPGDRLNVQAVFSEDVTIVKPDEFGGTKPETVQVFKTETVFGNIMVADLLNARGESILDIYEWYNNLSIWDQSKLDSSQSFREKTTPRILLVALTPEEKERYYYYLSKTEVRFKISLPQRVR